MAWEEVPNVVITSIFGKPWRTNVLDDDGEPVYVDELDEPLVDIVADGKEATNGQALATIKKDLKWTHKKKPSNANREVAKEDATTYTLLRELLLIMNSSDFGRMVHKPNDANYAQMLWNNIEKCRQAEFIKMKVETYKWLHGLLTRQVPVVKPIEQRDEEEDRNIEIVKMESRAFARPQTAGFFLYSLSEHTILEQLRSLNDLKSRTPVEDV